MYYAVVDKSTGKFFPTTNYVTDKDYPRADTLDVVPLCEELVCALITGFPEGSNSLPIVYTQTRYNFQIQEWEVAHDQVIQFDPVVELEKQRTKFLAEARRIASISDLSPSAQAKVNAYISDLENMVINDETKAEASHQIREFTW